MTHAWPPLPPELAERLMLGQDDFHAYVDELYRAVGPRAYGPAELELALGYPWPRPAESFVLRDGAVEPWDAALTEGRRPLLAIGSNAAPERLRLKVSELDDRTVPVEVGVLEDFDVGAAAAVTLYGAMPATLFPSPGTRVSLAILWVSDPQHVMLTWSEIGYWLGRLDGVRFGGRTLDVDAYVHRCGCFAPDGAPVALDAVPAAHRTAQALTQQELLDRAAHVIGHADAAALLTALFADSGAIAHASTAIRALAQPFASEHWTPYRAT